MLCNAGVHASRLCLWKGNVCKHLETEVWCLCGARYNCLLQCRKVVTERGLYFI